MVTIGAIYPLLDQTYYIPRMPVPILFCFYRDRVIRFAVARLIVPSDAALRPRSRYPVNSDVAIAVGIIVPAH